MRLPAQSYDSLVIVGAGGAGLEALFVARRLGAWNILGFADDDAALHGRMLEGVTVLGSIEAVLGHHGGRNLFFHCAIGRNAVRKRIAETFETGGFRPATLIDPTAVVAPSAVIGAGTYVGPLVFVGPFARAGRHCLINTGSSIGHHSGMGDFSQVCPGGRLSGHTTLGEGAFVGSNGVTVPGVTVGAWSTLGASSLALRDLPPQVTAIGVPAKVIAPAPPRV